MCVIRSGQIDRTADYGGDCAGIYRRLRNGGHDSVFVASRVARSDVPDEGLLEWLDERWLRMDSEVAERLCLRHE